MANIADGLRDMVAEERDIPGGFGLDKHKQELINEAADLLDSLDNGSDAEMIAPHLYFDHVDQHGYPNGLPTWDELPEKIEGRVDLYTREHWRSLAEAALVAFASVGRNPEGEDRKDGLRRNDEHAVPNASEADAHDQSD